MSKYHYKLEDANRRQCAITEEWFLRKVEKTSDCWWWRGSVAGSGYGVIMLQGEYANAEGKRHFTGAHRVAWQLFRGEIPGKLCVLHRCDQRICVNPEHLFLGDPRDNARDCVAKGRNGLPTLEQRPRGDQFTTTLITERAVWKLREYRKQGMTVNDVVLKTFLYASRAALRGKNWRHVGDKPPSRKDVASTQH